jgi:cytochrome P450
MPAAAPDDERLVEGFDLRTLSPEFYHNPYPTYRALRRLSPVHRLPDGTWFLTRHADLFAIYRDTSTFSSDKHVEFTPKFGAGTPLLEHHTTSLIFNDPPLHTRVRRLITGALTPRAVAAMEEGVTALVDGLLDRMAARAGTVDLLADFAAAIPIGVIGNLLDYPHERRAPLRDWSLAILGALEPAPTAKMLDAGNAAVVAFCADLAQLVADRRRHPGDPEHDVLTRLINGEAPGEPGGERLSERELLQNCIFILNAGHETTTNLIGSALWLLCRFPEQRARLLADPALMKPAVEEFLRYESSVQLGNRRATRDCDVGGVALPAGALITLCIAGANRDPDAFADPDTLDVGRARNPHLGFAGGPHVCAGLAVARLEARIALARFLHRFPRYALDGEPERDLRARFRGFRTLPARLT